jgi:hypothetical protein
MSKEKLFKDLIAEIVKDGNISTSEYNLLIEKGKDLGYSTKVVDMLIKLEMPASTSSISNPVFDDDKSSRIFTKADDEEYVFKSAITRGGSIITPDRIIVTRDKVIFKKRNSYLINVDTISIPISKISSVEVDTSIWGTDIVIRSYGGVEIVGKRFTKWDAKEIQKLIMDRQ